MRLEARKYLFDIQQAADSIRRFCAGKTFEQYQADDLLQAAVDGRNSAQDPRRRLVKPQPAS